MCSALDVLANQACTFCPYIRCRTPGKQTCEQPQKLQHIRSENTWTIMWHQGNGGVESLNEFHEMQPFINLELYVRQ